MKRQWGEILIESERYKMSDKALKEVFNEFDLNKGNFEIFSLNFFFQTEASKRTNSRKQ